MPQSSSIVKIQTDVLIFTLQHVLTNVDLAEIETINKKKQAKLSLLKKEMDKKAGVVIDTINPSTWDTEELFGFLASQGYISEALSQKIYIPYFTQRNLVQCYRK